MQLDLPFTVASEPEPFHDLRAISPRQFVPPPQVHFVRVRRARRYILRVQPDGSLRVTVPRGGSRREAEAFVRENRRWIERERGRVKVEHAPHEWTHGTQIMLRGDAVTLLMDDRSGGRAISYAGRRVVLEDLLPVRNAVEGDLREIAKTELIPRVYELAAEHGLEVRRVTIRNQRSRWGSCAHSGDIALNFRLVQMPDRIRDYVIVHELMHLRQQNHSRRFWRLVEAAFPAFREAELWLRTRGRSLF